MKLAKIVFIVVGFIALGMGIIGSILPILPTTPFLLIAFYCFARGSTYFHRWLCGTRIYKKYLYAYVTERKMTLKVKLCILLPATVMLTVAFVLSPWLHLRLLLILLCVFKYIYFFTAIATVKKNNNN